MKLTLLPLQNDEVVRIAGHGTIGSLVSQDIDPFVALLGAHVYSLRVLLDLENAQSVDTSGLGWLITASTRFKKAGGKLVLHSVPPLIQQILDFVQMADLLAIASDEETGRDLAISRGSEDTPSLRPPVHPFNELKKGTIPGG